MEQNNDKITMDELSRGNLDVFNFMDDRYNLFSDDLPHSPDVSHLTDADLRIFDHIFDLSPTSPDCDADYIVGSTQTTESSYSSQEHKAINVSINEEIRQDATSSPGHPLNATQKRTIFVSTTPGKVMTFQNTLMMQRLKLCRDYFPQEYLVGGVINYSGDFQYLRELTSTGKHTDIECAWYATISFLDKSHFLRITKRYSEIFNIPMEFVVIDADACMFYFNLFFLVLVNNEKNSQNIKTEMTKLWREVIKWGVNVDNLKSNAIAYFNARYDMERVTGYRFLIPFPDSFQQGVVFSFLPTKVLYPSIGYFCPREHPYLYYICGDPLSMVGLGYIYSNDTLFSPSSQLMAFSW
jgi:hypothetical protein